MGPEYPGEGAIHIHQHYSRVQSRQNSLGTCKLADKICILEHKKNIKSLRKWQKKIIMWNQCCSQLIPRILKRRTMNHKTYIQDIGGGGLKEGVGQPFWPGSTNNVGIVEKKTKNHKKIHTLFLLLTFKCWDGQLRTPRIVVDGTQVEVVDGTFLNIWRESGDWVALHNITSRGSTQKEGEWSG